MQINGQMHQKNNKIKVYGTIRITKGTFVTNATRDILRMMERRRENGFCLTIDSANTQQILLHPSKTSELYLFIKLENNKQIYVYKLQVQIEYH